MEIWSNAATLALDLLVAFRGAVPALTQVENTTINIYAGDALDPKSSDRILGGFMQTSATLEWMVTLELASPENSKRNKQQYNIYMSCNSSIITMSQQ